MRRFEMPRAERWRRRDSRNSVTAVGMVQGRAGIDREARPPDYCCDGVLVTSKVTLHGGTTDVHIGRSQVPAGHTPPAAESVGRSVVRPHPELPLLLDQQE